MDIEHILPSERSHQNILMKLALFGVLFAICAFGILNAEAAEIHSEVGPSPEIEKHVYGYVWESNELGISDQVPAPWTNLAYEQGKVRCWGREFFLDNGILPRQISSLGQTIFAHTPSITIEINGKRFDGLSKGKLEPQTRSDSNAVYKIVSIGEDFEVEGYVSLEYDGFLRTDIAIYPRKPVKLDAFVINFPLRAEIARFYSSFADYDYVKQVTARDLMAEGIGRIDQAIDMKFNPAVWLGNETVGIEWSCQSNIGWSVNDNNKTIQIEPSGNTVQLRINAISKSVVTYEPFSISFALYPTPVKRLPDNWRSRALVPAFQKPAALNPEIHQIYGITMGLPVRYPGLPLLVPGANKSLPPKLNTASEAIQDTRVRMKRNGIKLVPYSALYALPARLPQNEWKDFGDYWKTATLQGDFRKKEWADWQDILLPGQQSNLSICLYSRSVQDLFVWQFVEGIRKFDTSGLYLDLATPLALCRNPHHPHGRFVRDGAQYYPFFWQRELMKRLYVACKSMKPDFPLIVHQGKIPIVCCGFSDFVLSGEFLNVSFAKGAYYDPDYSEFPDTFYQAEFLQTRGFEVVMLPQILKWGQERITGNPGLFRKYTRTLLARTAVFDIPIYAARMDMDYYEKYLGAFEKFGWLGNVEFFGPSESVQLLNRSPDPLKIGMYLKPGADEILLAAANLGNTVGQATISFNGNMLRKAGVNLRKDFSVLNAMENTLYPHEDAGFNVKLEANDFALFIIK